MRILMIGEGRRLVMLARMVELRRVVGVSEMIAAHGRTSEGGIDGDWVGRCWDGWSFGWIAGTASPQGSIINEAGKKGGLTTRKVQSEEK